MPRPLASVQMLFSLDDVATVQSFLVNGGRFLLTFGMALFLSYLLFMLASIVIAVGVSRLRRTNERAARESTLRRSTDDVPHGRRLVVVPVGGDVGGVATASAVDALPGAHRAAA